MKKSFSFLLWSALLLSASSCITEEPDFSTEVVSVGNTTTPYYGSDHSYWNCLEALIYVESQPKYVIFPEQYKGDIVSGTKVDWNCYRVTDYYKDGKKITVDWDGTKL